MQLDELAFFNQQLAGMLRDGIPLEGALRQLAAGMRDERLQKEVRLLEADLAKGLPLKDALLQRDLPDLYKKMIEAGARANDLPGTLLLMADHYQRVNLLWTRFKGIMVYPLLVLLTSLVLSVFLSLVFSHFLRNVNLGLWTGGNWLTLLLWIPPVAFASTLLVVALLVSIPSLRVRLRWRLTGFREASLAQLASTMALVLRSGTPLPEALALVEELEAGSPAGTALANWRQLLNQGAGTSGKWLIPDNPPFPPLFLWLLRQGGEDLAAGFQNAANLYHTRATHRADMLLYAALPISTILLGQVVFWQVTPVFETLRRILGAIGE